MKLFAVLLSGALASAASLPDCHAVFGWEQKGQARSYVADNLFEYMDGNAEGYLLYQFVNMRGVTCVSGGDTIVIDISEMSDAEAAYGMFSANRDARLDEERIGMGGQIRPRRVIFAKDKYYVELAADPAKDHTPALRAFSTALERSIPGRTELPDALRWFPKEQLKPGTLRLIPESVLGMRLLKRGYAAEYDFGKMFVVREESPQAAAAVMEKLRARLGPTLPARLADEAFEVTDKYLGRMCFFRKGRYVGGAAGVAPDQDATAWAAKLAACVPE